MAEINKPVEKPEWASANPIGIVVPSNSKRQTGWSGPPEKPPFQFFNWFQNTVYNWILWIEEKVELTFGGKLPTTLIVNAGVITPTGSQHSVDTES